MTERDEKFWRRIDLWVAAIAGAMTPLLISEVGRVMDGEGVSVLPMLTSCFFLVLYILVRRTYGPKRR